MKKRFAKILAVLLGVFVLAGCSGNTNNKKETKSADKITVWAWDETFNIKAMNIAKEFDKDAKVEVVNMNQDDIVQKLNTILSSGSTDGLPNIVLIEDYRIQGYLKSYPKAFADLSKIVDPDKFASYKLAVNTIDGKNYGLPFDSGVTGWFYRRDYLEQAGFKEQDLQNVTWDRFIEIARIVKEKTGHPIMSMDPSDLGLTRVIMQSAGSWYTKKDGKTVNIKDNKALKYGVNVEATLIKEGLIEQVSDWNGGVKAVQSGNVASSPNGSWYSSTIKGGKDQSGKWGIAPIPNLKGIQSVNASSLGGAGWYVLKGVPGEKKAIDFLGKTFASNMDLMDRLAKEVGVVSTMVAAKDSATYQEESEFYGGQKVFADFSKWAAEVPEVNYGKDTYAIEAVMSEALQRVVNGEKIDDVFKEIQDQVEQQLNTSN